SPEGLGLKNAIKKLGYGFLKVGKISWTGWQFHPDVKDHILFRTSYLQSSRTSRYRQVAHTADFHGHCAELFSRLEADFRESNPRSGPRYPARVYKHLQIVWKWACENLVWEFQKVLKIGNF
ncbi:hypothetical protein BDZ91DRAFT_784554, partial [Kalaharituber pfeilii]